ncbi:hypothetical protein [Flavobacterium rhizosphaerae]|uniref:Outer membrane protein beta-barrel domain-containing protein n=1 Tax=Flavobacterium rhizosphaerae TaxID=3163298 RepID=A0ABW8YXI9_9FLAO
MRIDGAFIQGFKLGGWIGGGGGNLGLNIINYTDWHQNSLCIRPEVGFGYDIIRFVYGYNIAFTNKGLSGVNTYNFSVNLTLNLKKENDKKRNTPVN